MLTPQLRLPPSALCDDGPVLPALPPRSLCGPLSGFLMGRDVGRPRRVGRIGRERPGERAGWMEVPQMVWWMKTVRRDAADI